MTENWKSYFCRVNDIYASVAVDLGLNENAPMAAKPWLLWVRLYLRSPRPDGLSSQEEFPTLCTIEDKVTEQLGEACAAIQVGRITTDGRRELYFYGATERNFKSVVRETMSMFPEYRCDFDMLHESDWNQYLNVLCPSDEDMQQIKNLDVLEVLERHGDTLDAVRDVHHWIYFKSLEDREWYAQQVAEIGYTIEDQNHRPKDEHPYGITITRDQSVTHNEIHDAVMELFRLAKQVDAEYDGWETQVITVKN